MNRIALLILLFSIAPLAQVRTSNPAQVFHSGIAELKAGSALDVYTAGETRPITWTKDDVAIAVCTDAVFYKEPPSRVKSVSGCKIAEGHTLDELLGLDMQALSDANDRTEQLRRQFLEYLKRVDTVLKTPSK